MFEVIVTTREMDGQKVQRPPVFVATSTEVVSAVADQLRLPGDHAVVLEHPTARFPRAWAAFHRYKNGRILYAVPRSA